MAESREKTYVEDVDRSVYDIRDEEHDAYRMEEGVIVRNGGAELVDEINEKGFGSLKED